MSIVVKVPLIAMASRMGQLARVDQRAASYKFESSDRLLPSATSIPNSIRCRFADCSLDLNALAYTIIVPLCHFTVLASFCTCRRLRGRVGVDTQPRPKPRPITSPDRPGLPNFSRETLKNMGRPGYEAMCSYSFFSGYVIEIILFS